MAREIMATIRLCAGRVGYYDPLSRIHLSIARPEANVLSGTNCAQLRRSVKDGVIRLLNGTLGEDVPPFRLVKNNNGTYSLTANTAEEMKPVFAESKKAAPAEEKVEKAEESAAKVVEAAAEEVKETEDVKAEVKEAEAPVEEEKPAKKSGTKGKTTTSRKTKK